MTAQAEIFQRFGGGHVFLRHNAGLVVTCAFLTGLAALAPDIDYFSVTDQAMRAAPVPGVIMLAKCTFPNCGFRARPRTPAYAGLDG